MASFHHIFPFIDWFLPDFTARYLLLGRTIVVGLLVSFVSLFGVVLTSFALILPLAGSLGLILLGLRFKFFKETFLPYVMVFCCTVCISILHYKYIFEFPDKTPFHVLNYIPTSNAPLSRIACVHAHSSGSHDVSAAVY
jgi:hypothetical protein